MESPVSSVRRRPLAFVPLLALFFSACGPTAPPSPPGLAVSPQRPVLTQGDTLRLTATVGGHGVESGSAIRWTSLNGGVATVSSLGTVRAVGVGVAMIVAALQSDADTIPVVVQPPALRSLASARGFVMGTSVDVNALRLDAQFQQQLALQYNGVTSEWAMKFGPIHPGATQYNFIEADRLVSFAQQHGMTVHGHTLVWGDGLPGWVTNGKFTAAQLLQVLHNHIATVVGRYKGKIASWDVVNEVVDDTAPLRHTLWLQVIGPGYVDSAFVWAHQADPAAKLYLNENHAEGSGPKADAVLALVQGLRARGIPIDGVGFQAHFTLTPPPPAAADLQANLARFAAAGFSVRVSEMDVRVADAAPAGALDQEATIYHDMLDACLRLGSRCTGFTSWGFTDKYSWIPKFYPGYGRALPFDASYQSKPADAALVTRLQQP
ncbi:MAG TPA: endo-1,4-beta-xylanase [Gemmatimonadales bacterium]|nr:endo-1,4-beta-xylanase [Gemmatimonadales bacterium]